MNSWFTRPSLRSYTQCFLSSLEPRYLRCLHLLTSSPTPTHPLYRPAVSVELNLSRAGLQSLPLPCHLPFSGLGSFFPHGHIRHFLATTHWRRPWCWERLKAREKGTTEDEMVGWHHWLSGHEVEQTPGDNEGQGSLVCCDSWGRKSQTRLSDWTSTTTLSLGSFSLWKMTPGLKCSPSESWSMYF